ncbi:MAG: endonuclease domain-containing protein [Eubacteriales bacterium]|nr:endonuclease domain-containing protein [Eubacteriales bacterium]
MEYNQKLTTLAQKLRKNMTMEERILWYHYLNKLPVRFRRQYVIGRYIVDFYCHEARLVIELDGSQHYMGDGPEQDAKRTEYLKEQGLRVLRFANTDVQKNLAGVCDKIDLILMEQSRKMM